MSRNPKVTIGVPVYNGELFLRETLDSIVAQTFEDYEVILSDNASVDGTEQICREYAARDPRVLYVRNERNLGIARNFQQLVRLASGKYFKLANADDLCHEELVARCVEVLDRERDVVLCYGRTFLIDERSQLLGAYEDRLDLRSFRTRERLRLVMKRIGLVNVLQGVVRSEALRQTGLLGSYVGSDVVLVAELALYGEFYELPERLFFRRMHAGAFSSLKTEESEQAYMDPARRKRVTLFWWRHYFEYMRAVGRAPLPVRERRGLMYDVVRRAISARYALLGDLLGVLGRAKAR